MKFHLQVLQTLTQLKCNWHLTTLAAVSTGLGAAAGYKILPWYFLLLPLVMLYTLNRRQLILSLVLFISGIISGITMVFVPSISTFYISQKLGGGSFDLIGDTIERQFQNVSTYNIGAAISLVMMILILISVAIMNKFSDDEGGIIV